MDTSEVRLQFADSLPAGFSNLVERALLAQDVVTTQSSTAPTLYFIDSDRSAIVDLAWNSTDSLGQRYLVISVGDRALPPLFYHRLLKAGASDVLTWDEGNVCAMTIGERLRRWAAISRAVESPRIRETLIGRSVEWTQVLRRVVELAAFGDSPVLVTGESGTGKELVARIIHELDSRKSKGDFVVLDCSTIAKELSGSEFFGHEKGAFTGAISARQGAFSLANGGTLFLDELGELPLALQAELLRVVQEKTYKRVGSNVWQSAEFRLVSATNRSLEQEQLAGRFRGDLLYRVTGWTIRLPPLRERRQDIIPLASHFLTQRLGYAPAIDTPVRDYLMFREYPGNIRELRQLTTRIAQRHVGTGPITIGELGDDLALTPIDESVAWCDTAFEKSIERAVALGVGLKEIGRVAEDIAVKLAVQSESGSLQAAARRLGVTDRALQLRRAHQRTSEPAPSEAAAERAS